MPEEPKRNSLGSVDVNYLDVEPEERTDYLDTGPIAQQDQLELVQEAPGDDISDEMLREDVDRADSWLTYNKGLEQTGYSPAEHLSSDNVDELVEEYVVETDSAGLQTNPVITPGDPPVMYFTQQNNVVQAVNARTGDQYWEHDMAIEREEFSDWGILADNNRGVAVSGDKVYTSTVDGFLVALNRYTGELEWRTDLLWEEDLPDELEEYPQVVAGLTAPPIVYDGTVFSGSTSDQINWTYVLALDAESGEVQWRETNVPPSEWVEDTWALGNGAAWMTPTLDPETETVLFNTGDPSAFFNSLHRPGPNKHTASIRAFDFGGENKWNHQIVTHDLWDYDVGSTPSIANVEIDGEERRVILEDTKDGWVHVIDLETGRLIQRSEPYAKQEHRFGAWPDSEFLNMPPFGEENAAPMFPATSGASEWPPDAYSPRTNMRYVGAMDAANEVYGEGFFLDMVEYGDDDNQYVAGGSSNYDDHENVSRIAALDVDSGELAWEYVFDDVDPAMPTPWPGGPTATAGGIVFGPSAGGNLVALDDETGDELWVGDTEGRITASPVVWGDPEAERGFVAVASDDRIITYSTNS